MSRPGHSVRAPTGQANPTAQASRVRNLAYPRRAGRSPFLVTLFINAVKLPKLPQLFWCRLLKGSNNSIIEGRVHFASRLYSHAIILHLAAPLLAFLAGLVLLVVAHSLSIRLCAYLGSPRIKTLRLTLPLEKYIHNSFFIYSTNGGAALFEIFIITCFSYHSSESKSYKEHGHNSFFNILQFVTLLSKRFFFLNFHLAKKN